MVGSSTSLNPKYSGALARMRWCAASVVVVCMVFLRDAWNKKAGAKQSLQPWRVVGSERRREELGPQPGLKSVGVCHGVSLFTTTPAKREAGAADTRKVAKRLAAWPCSLCRGEKKPTGWWAGEILVWKPRVFGHEKTASMGGLGCRRWWV